MNERETWVERPEHEIKTSEFQMQLGLASLTFEPGVALGRDEEVRSDHVRGPILLLSHPLATWITPQKKRRARLFHKFSIQTFQQSNLSCHFFFLEKINHLSWQSRKASQRHPQLFLCPPVGMTTVGKEDGVVHGSQQKIWICRSLFTTPSRLCDLSNWNFLLSNCRNGAHPGLLQSNFQKI